MVATMVLVVVACQPSFPVGLSGNLSVTSCRWRYPFAEDLQDDLSWAGAGAGALTQNIPDHLVWCLVQQSKKKKPGETD